MPRDLEISRRALLGVGLGAVTGLMARRVLGSPVIAACPEATPRQIEGPFRPTRDREDEDADLTRVKGRIERAAGDILSVRGQVLDDACRPVEGAVVEIWQANTWGRYDHERDAGNPRPLDPNFQGWAEMLTDVEGRYGFKTVKPGSYPVDDQGWIRPPHIHFKISRRGYHELITQMYFRGEPLNEPDQIRRALAPKERDRVTVEFRPAPLDLKEGASLGTFDIMLRRAG